MSRDVTSSNSNSTTFKLQMFSPDSKKSTNVLSALLSNANLWKNRCSMTNFIRTESQKVQTNLFFFSNSTYCTNYSY